MTEETEGLLELEIVYTVLVVPKEETGGWISSMPVI